MDQPPEWFADALASGESDRVNDAIDRVEAMDATELVPVYAALFETCRPVYENDDGYVRQSVVRFLRDAYPRLEIRIAGSAADSVDGYAPDDLFADRARLTEFLLEALVDDDGRVRRAAVDGLRMIGTAMELAELDAEREALTEEVEELEATHSESKREHIEQARQAVGTDRGLSGLLS